MLNAATQQTTQSTAMRDEWLKTDKNTWMFMITQNWKEKLKRRSVTRGTNLNKNTEQNLNWNSKEKLKV